MPLEYRIPDCNRYEMDRRHPLRRFEAVEKEQSVVHDCLESLVEAGILPHSDYNEEGLIAMQRALEANFEIPWTAITPRMQRLLYAINCISKPGVMIGVGIFCGYTFISNAGAAIGPGSCYRAEKLIGIEIDPDEASRARRNVSSFAGTDGFRIVAADGVTWLREFNDDIDLLYLDANGRGSKGKAIYLDILRSALHCLHPGSLVLAHNSFNSAQKLEGYLKYVRSKDNFRQSLNAVIDDQGLEVSLR